MLDQRRRLQRLNDISIWAGANAVDANPRAGVRVHLSVRARILTTNSESNQMGKWVLCWRTTCCCDIACSNSNQGTIINLDLSKQFSCETMKSDMAESHTINPIPNISSTTAIRSANHYIPHVGRDAFHPFASSCLPNIPRLILQL